MASASLQIYADFKSDTLLVAPAISSLLHWDTDMLSLTTTFLRVLQTSSNRD